MLQLLQAHEHDKQEPANFTWKMVKRTVEERTARAIEATRLWPARDGHGSVGEVQCGTYKSLWPPDNKVYWARFRFVICMRSPN